MGIQVSRSSAGRGLSRPGQEAAADAEAAGDRRTPRHARADACACGSGSRPCDRCHTTGACSSARSQPSTTSSTNSSGRAEFESSGTSLAPSTVRGLNDESPRTSASLCCQSIHSSGNSGHTPVAGRDRHSSRARPRGILDSGVIDGRIGANTKRAMEAYRAAATGDPVASLPSLCSSTASPPQMLPLHSSADDPDRSDGSNRSCRRSATDPWRKRSQSASTCTPEFLRNAEHVGDFAAEDTQSCPCVQHLNPFTLPPPEPPAPKDAHAAADGHEQRRARPQHVSRMSSRQVDRSCQPFGKLTHRHRRRAERSSSTRRSPPAAKTTRCPSANGRSTACRTIRPSVTTPISSGMPIRRTPRRRFPPDRTNPVGVVWIDISQGALRPARHAGALADRPHRIARLRAADELGRAPPGGARQAWHARRVHRMRKPASASARATAARPAHVLGRSGLRLPRRGVPAWRRWSGSINRIVPPWTRADFAVPSPRSRRSRGEGDRIATIGRPRATGRPRPPSPPRLAPSSAPTPTSPARARGSGPPDAGGRRPAGSADAPVRRPARRQPAARGDRHPGPAGHAREGGRGRARSPGCSSARPAASPSTSSTRPRILLLLRPPRALRGGPPGRAKPFARGR